MADEPRTPPGPHLRIKYRAGVVDPADLAPQPDGAPPRIFERLGRPEAEVTLEVNGKPVGPMLLQGVQVKLTAADMVPVVNLEVVPGAIEILLEGGVLTVEELVRPRMYSYTMGGEVFVAPAPFPLTKGELLDCVANFVLTRADKRYPNVVHVPDAMYSIIVPRWFGSPAVLSEHFTICGMAVVRHADQFRLEYDPTRR